MSNVSYTQIVSTSKVHPIAPQLPKENVEPTLNKILAALNNVTQTLTNITARLDELETKQTKSKITSQKKKKEPYSAYHSMERQWVSKTQARSRRPIT
jgi:hypothetical protein